MFKLDGEVWEGSCRMRAIENEELQLHLASFYNPAPDPATTMPMFSLIVASCDRQFARLRSVNFASGDRLVPGEDGVLEVFEYPGGKNFIMQDPSGNRFLIAEDYRERAAE